MRITPNREAVTGWTQQGICVATNFFKIYFIFCCRYPVLLTRLNLNNSSFQFLIDMVQSFAFVRRLLLIFAPSTMGPCMFG